MSNKHPTDHLIFRELQAAIGTMDARISVVVKLANALPDSVYYSLSSLTQDWLNDAIEAANNKRPLPPFDEVREVVPLRPIKEVLPPPIKKKTTFYPTLNLDSRKRKWIVSAFPAGRTI